MKRAACAISASEIGIRQVGYRDWITARSPDATEQAFFGLAHDATVFENFRTAFDQTGTPLRVTVTVFPADRNQFIINVGPNVPLAEDPSYETWGTQWRTTSQPAIPEQAPDYFTSPR